MEAPSVFTQHEGKEALEKQLLYNTCVTFGHWPTSPYFTHVLIQVFYLETSNIHHIITQHEVTCLSQYLVYISIYIYFFLNIQLIMSYCG